MARGPRARHAGAGAPRCPESAAWLAAEALALSGRSMAFVNSIAGFNRRTVRTGGAGLVGRKQERLVVDDIRSSERLDRMSSNVAGTRSGGRKAGETALG